MKAVDDNNRQINPSSWLSARESLRTPQLYSANRLTASSAWVMLQLMSDSFFEIVHRACQVRFKAARACPAVRAMANWKASAIIGNSSWSPGDPADCQGVLNEFGGCASTVIRWRSSFIPHARLQRLEPNVRRKLEPHEEIGEFAFPTVIHRVWNEVSGCFNLSGIMIFDDSLVEHAVN